MKHTLQSWYNHKRILVTGGAGFIGSHIVDLLVACGAQVRILDNLSTGSKENVRQVQENIDVIKGDIRDLQTVLTATHGIDCIFHLAAYVSVPGSLAEPDICNAINIEGTKNLLQAATTNNVSSLVFSSSSAVYGQRDDACKESDTPNPQSPYATSKLVGEQLCKAWARKNNTSSACLRYFNVFGPRQNPHGHYAAVVAKFTQALENEKPIIMYGDGYQTRDFIHVSHVAQANLLAGMRTDLQGEIFNVASGNSINLFELLSDLESAVGSKPQEITFLPARAGDVKNSQADPRKFKRFFGH